MYSSAPPLNTKTPMCLLSEIIKEERLAIVFLRNNKKIIAKLKAFDKHFNLILDNIREIWNENDKTGKLIFKERYIGKMLLRGDSVILILPLKVT